MYENQEALVCANCGKNLFEDIEMSIVVFVRDRNTGDIVDIYTCCKGECDKILKNARARRIGVDGWKDLSDFVNPTLFLKHIMSMMNNMHEGVKIKDEAFENYKNLILSVAPYVMREPSEKEKKEAIYDNMYSF